MVKNINVSLPIKERVGQIGINNQGLKMTIIEYKGNKDLSIKFEDGFITEHKRYDHFLEGRIANPNYCHCKNLSNRVGDININNQGLKMTIIEYVNAKDIKVQFEDGTIVENRQYDDFLRGKITNSNVLSDGISIPEKFMWNVLKELNIGYTTQLSEEWCQNYRYDFYIPSLDMIIETHGMQHYNGSFKNLKSGRTLKEEQKNDQLKKELALNNNIKKYVVIDCRKSELEWLKENVEKELAKYFDLSNINWKLIWENSLKNLVWEVKKLTEENYSNKQIAEMLGVSVTTIKNYKKCSGLEMKTKQEIKQENLEKTKELFQQGKTSKQIAKILNVNIDTIGRYKKDLNIKEKTKQEIKQENLEKTKELFQQGKTNKQIAEILNVSERTIRNYKKELNL